jgi:hypothetical protein
MVSHVHIVGSGYASMADRLTFPNYDTTNALVDFSCVFILFQLSNFNLSSSDRIQISDRVESRCSQYVVMSTSNTSRLCALDTSI